MSQFQTLIRSRDSPLNMQTFVLVVFIDAIIPMPEFTNGLVENVPCTNKDTKNFSVDNVCGIFEDNYIFVENFNTSSQSYQPILETVTINLWDGGSRTDIWG